MKLIIFVCCIRCCFQLSAQNLQPNYVGTELNIPADYTVNPDGTISNDRFSAFWKEVPEILYQNNVHKQMIKQMEDDAHARFISGIEFTSQGAPLIGKLYQLKNKTGIRYRILASGIVNQKPMILDLGFSKLPRHNSDLDDFIQRFIQFKS